jgi:hypothetical protein
VLGAKKITALLPKTRIPTIFLYGRGVNFQIAPFATGGLLREPLAPSFTLPPPDPLGPTAFLGRFYGRNLGFGGKGLRGHYRSYCCNFIVQKRLEVYKIKVFCISIFIRTTVYYSNKFELGHLAQISDE